LDKGNPIWSARERGEPMIEAAVENKYDFNMQVSLPAMAVPGQSSLRLADSHAAICLDQIDQWVTPRLAGGAVRHRQRTVAATSRASHITVIDPAMRILRLAVR
jgi:hypothetical protein